MSGILYVALGGAIGASARHILGEGAKKTFGAEYPYGTLTANILGSLLMGVLVAWLAHRVTGSDNLRLFLGVGLLGGFTTFSAFSLDAVLMYERKAFGALFGYVSSSVIISCLALVVGLMIGRKVFGA